MKASHSPKLEHFKIENLAAQAQWLSVLVGWHHAEWMQTVDIQIVPIEEIAAARQTREDQLRLHLKDDTVPSTFVASRDGQPVASASVIYHQQTDIVRKSIWLTNVYVLPEWRCRGLGERMVNEVLQYCCLNKIKHLQLYTFDTSPYYLKRGWRYECTSKVRGRDVDILSITPSMINHA